MRWLIHVRCSWVRHNSPRTCFDTQRKLVYILHITIISYTAVIETCIRSRVRTRHVVVCHTNDSRSATRDFAGKQVRTHYEHTAVLPVRAFTTAAAQPTV